MFQDVERVKDDETTVYIKKFNDLNDFLVSIKTEDINPVFTSFSSKYEDYQFTQTNSYEEAWNLCRFTMNKGFEQFYHKFKKINFQLDEMERTVDIYSVVGYTPSVPRYLLGIPTSMQKHDQVREKKQINIYMNIAYRAGQTKEQIENRGILVLNLISYLEKQGYQVKLFTYIFAKEWYEKILLIISLKERQERINVKKLYFPLVHPSFVRRLCFRSMEKMPIQNLDWDNGYGYPIGYKEATIFLEKYFNYQDEKNIYISNPNELGIKGKNLEEDLESFLETINNKYHVIENEKVYIRRK